MSEWNPPSDEVPRPPRSGGGPGLGAVVAGAAFVLAAALLSNRGSSPSAPTSRDEAAGLLKPLTGRLAAGLIRSPYAPSVDELEVMEALSRDPRFRKATLLDRKLVVRWAGDPTLVSTKWDKPDADGFPLTRCLIESLEGHKPCFRSGPKTREEIVYPIGIGDDVAGLLCVALDLKDAQGPVKVSLPLEVGSEPTAVSTTPLTFEDLPRVDVEIRSVARQHYLEGVIHYMKGEYDKARGSWNLARSLDTSNAEVALALRQLNRVGAPEPGRSLTKKQQLAQQHYWNGIAFFALKQFQKARFELTLAKELDPANPDVQASLNRLDNMTSSEESSHAR